MPVEPKQVRIVFKKLEQKLLKLSGDRQPEHVHGFRTGTRRLQTLLENMTPVRDRNQEKLLKLLTRVRKRAGKVRDLDVQLAALRSLKTPHEPRRKTQLMQSLIELRSEYDKKLRKSLDEDSVRQICRRLKRTFRELKLDSVCDPLTTAHHMLARVPDGAGGVSEELLHQYRILTKRARYAAEFAVRSPQRDGFIAGLRTLQDALGDWHDWLMLSQTAARKLGDLQESPLLAVLHNVVGTKSRRAIGALSTSPLIQHLQKNVPGPRPSGSYQGDERHSRASGRTTTAA